MFINRFAFITVLLLFVSPILAQEKNYPDFQQGLKAFKQGRYQAALSSFKKAEKNGMREAQLYFNLGVTHFKLNNYTAANRAFKQTAKSKKLRQLAWFNLGLVAEKQGRDKTAKDWYQKTIKLDSRSKTAALARKKINPAKEQSGWDGRLSIGLGYDDNVTLVTTDSPTLRDDTYLQTFAYARYPLSKQTRFKVLFNWQDYSDVDTADYWLLSGGASHQLRYTNWQFVPEFMLSQSRLNNKSYQTILDLKLAAYTRLSKYNKLALRYRYSDIQSDNIAYDYLQGQRHQLRADIKQQLSDTQLRWRYQFEINDRQNLPTADYSPTRHTLQARLRHKLNERLTAIGSIGFRRSDYGEAAGFSRSDDRLRLRAEARYDINRDWSTRLRYTYTDNDSNLPAEVYERNDVQLLAQLRF